MHGDVWENIRGGLIGRDAVVRGPFGEKPLVYADYVASGRAIIQIEQLLLEDVLPYYSNSHTDASYCGALMTRLRKAARAEIARVCGAGREHAVIFCGTGATAGLNRLVHLLGLHNQPPARCRPLVITGPYEHHSNILPWRESGAEVIAISEAAAGGPDLEQLQAALADAAGRFVIGAFSAASNVTGHLSDCHGVQARGGCACAGPYAHRLLGIGKQESRRLRQSILAGREIEKPGFVRLNLCYLLTDAEASFIYSAVTTLADEAENLQPFYEADQTTAIFRPRFQSAGPTQLA